MNEDPHREEWATAQAARELRDLQAQVERARATLVRLRAEIVDTQGQLDTTPAAGLLEANEALVLALLSRNAEASSIDAAGATAAQLTAVAALRQRELTEANEHLVLAALHAQDHQALSESAQRRQTEFLAVLAHELRGPLAPIRTAVELLQRLRTDEPELLFRLSGVIERQVVHVGRIIADLLDVSRLHTGKLRLERQLVDMSTIINNVCDACRPAMDARHQQFRCQAPASGLQVFGDPLRLTQVFQNLLDNSSKYTQSGGVIDLVSTSGGGYLVITVSDNGIGITADALAHVFEPFIQDAHAAEYSVTGLGIGLALAHQLVEAHGGTIIANSDGIGTGSRFTTTLPVLTTGRPSASAATAG